MSPRAHTFPRTHRLSTRADFSRVFEARIREVRGPLAIYGHANGLDHCRLGLSVSRAVGTAPRRNRIKRLLREAFRLHQHELAPGLDLVVAVRPHKPMPLESYATSLLTAAQRLRDRV